MVTTAFRPIVLLCTLVVIVGAVPARAAEFYRLGEDDLANGVSPDGSLVLTTRNVWTRGGGFVPFSPEVLVYSRDLADNGYVVGLVDGSYVPARVRAGEPVLELGGLGGPSGGGSGDAFGVTPDGNVVVGYAFSPTGPQAFRWTSATGTVGLGHLAPGTHHTDSAYGVSGDGSVVVGVAESEPDVSQAFRWTQATGMVGLGDLPGGEFHSEARAVSGDGRVVVGSSNGATGIEAFRWTPEGGMVALGDVPGGDVHSMALATTADGGLVVGESRASLVATPRAFIWTESGGMRDLQDVLTDEYGLGPALAGWDLYVASDVSDDGRVIVGYGSNPAGELEGFVVIVPEPSAAVLAVAISATLFAGRRRRSR